MWYERIDYRKEINDFFILQDKKCINSISKNECDIFSRSRS